MAKRNADDRGKAAAGAAERITRKYRPNAAVSMSPARAFDTVSSAIYVHSCRADQGRQPEPWDPPAPTAADMLDSLRMVEERRRAVDYDELCAIGAFLAAGGTLTEIGEAMGFGDAQHATAAARNRLATLRRRWPGWQMPEPTKPDPANAAAEISYIDERIAAGTASTDDIVRRTRLARDLPGAPPAPNPPSSKVLDGGRAAL